MILLGLSYESIERKAFSRIDFHAPAGVSTIKMLTFAYLILLRKHHVELETDCKGIGTCIVLYISELLGDYRTGLQVVDTRTHSSRAACPH